MSAADLKVKLEAFVTQQQASLTRLDAEYTSERARLVDQITKTQFVLTKWDSRIEVVIDTLALAGITVKAG